jgi:hypothetical protein
VRGLLPLIALALMAQAPPPAPSEQDEIVVMARKLDKLKIRFGGGRKNGVIVVKSCKVKQSSGDPEVDLVGCNAVNYCATQQINKNSVFNKCVKTRAEFLGSELLDNRRKASDTE